MRAEVLLPLGNRDVICCVEAMSDIMPGVPFSETAVSFIGNVSANLLQNPSVRQYPELIATAHWMRKAHILELQRDFESLCIERVRVPRGLVLHFAPSNVDSIFLYSWFLSLLMGNANLVRLSSRRGEQLDLLISILNAELESKEFASIRSRNLIVTYEHDEALTSWLSERCHSRVVWGGDATVQSFRKIPLNPLATEVVFPDRFSFALLEASKVLEASEEVIAKLANAFYADAFWFAQMACSSPRLVIWIGESSRCLAAKERFWRALADCLVERKQSFPEVVGFNKLTQGYKAVAEGWADEISGKGVETVARVHVGSDAAQVRFQHCGGGLFYECEMADLSSVAQFVTAKDQTMSYFGFDKQELREFVRLLRSRAIDRVVPIGQALNFNQVWDGQNLLTAFSREITIL